MSVDKLRYFMFFLACLLAWSRTALAAEETANPQSHFLVDEKAARADRTYVPTDGWIFVKQQGKGPFFLVEGKGKSIERLELDPTNEVKITARFRLIKDSKFGSREYTPMMKRVQKGGGGEKPKEELAPWFVATYLNLNEFQIVPDPALLPLNHKDAGTRRGDTPRTLKYLLNKKPVKAKHDLMPNAPMPTEYTLDPAVGVESETCKFICKEPQNNLKYEQYPQLNTVQTFTAHAKVGKQTLSASSLIFLMQPFLKQLKADKKGVISFSEPKWEYGIKLRADHVNPYIHGDYTLEFGAGVEIFKPDGLKLASGEKLDASLAYRLNRAKKGDTLKVKLSVSRLTPSTSGSSGGSTAGNDDVDPGGDYSKTYILDEVQPPYEMHLRSTCLDDKGAMIPESGIDAHLAAHGIPVLYNGDSDNLGGKTDKKPWKRQDAAQGQTGGENDLKQFWLDLKPTAPNGKVDYDSLSVKFSIPANLKLYRTADKSGEIRNGELLPGAELKKLVEVGFFVEGTAVSGGNLVANLLIADEVVLSNQVQVRVLDLCMIYMAGPEANPACLVNGKASNLALLEFGQQDAAYVLWEVLQGAAVLTGDRGSAVKVKGGGGGLVKIGVRMPFLGRMNDPWAAAADRSYLSYRCLSGEEIVYKVRFNFFFDDKDISLSGVAADALKTAATTQLQAANLIALQAGIRFEPEDSKIIDIENKSWQDKSGQIHTIPVTKAERIDPGIWRVNLGFSPPVDFNRGVLLRVNTLPNIINFSYAGKSDKVGKTLGEASGFLQMNVAADKDSEEGRGYPGFTTTKSTMDRGFVAMYSDGGSTLAHECFHCLCMKHRSIDAEDDTKGDKADGLNPEFPHPYLPLSHASNGKLTMLKAGEYNIMWYLKGGDDIDLMQTLALRAGVKK